MSDKSFSAWTDHPITELYDRENYIAPVRSCKVLGYDGNKYLTVEVEGVRKSIKSGYVYQNKGRYHEVNSYHHKWLCKQFGLKP